MHQCCLSNKISVWLYFFKCIIKPRNCINGNKLQKDFTNWMKSAPYNLALQDLLL